ncbi:MAG: hypothetical protein AYK22_03885 [Thermoplasmatales archaeon SG8-52-3]|nr:MAG: hypothetical protein AYK22_03885 [Thermoplasmatales archaeon SG8-52-3]
MNYIKKISLFFVIIMCLSLIGTQASAHPPGFMNLKYEENNLRVLIIHFSIAPKGSHYVYRIEIEVNGELVQEENYEQQERFIFQIYNFEISAEPGDEIIVTAYCSLFGQKVKSITV